jgi:plastocyanin
MFFIYRRDSSANFHGQIRRVMGMLLVTINCCFSQLARAEQNIHRVTIEAMKFSPDVLTINLGETLEWENKDLFPHDMTVTKDAIKSGEIAPAQRWKFKPTKKGEYLYICSLHPTMKAKFIVR